GGGGLAGGASLSVGGENPGAGAGETGTPRRNVPRAVFLSIAMMGVGYVLFAYATVTGFGYNATALTGTTVPFITVAHNVLAGFAFFAYMAGLTSTLGVLIAAINSQARLIFNAGRERLLPSWLGRGGTKHQTPVKALYTFTGTARPLLVAWLPCHPLGRSSADREPVN